MFLFILLPAFLVLAMVLIAGPALLPFALVAAVVMVVYRAVTRHHHPDQSLHTH
jgi:ABC-type branched-subunit amino acid transport system permease subunit